MRREENAGADALECLLGQIHAIQIEQVEIQLSVIAVLIMLDTPARFFTLK